MSAIWFDRDLAGYRVVPRPSTEANWRKSILRRIRAAFLSAPGDEADRHMTRLLRQSGGRLTDDIERQLAQQLTRNGNMRF